METPLFLAVQTAQRCYLVPRNQIDHLVRIRPDEPELCDARGRPLLLCALGPLLDPRDHGPTAHQHALTVALRRRSVALLVARADRLERPGPLQPLAPWFAHQLARPWIMGVVVTADQPILVLDLRRIATDVALGVV